MSAIAIPSLVGVIHLPALPGSPRYRGDLRALAESAARDARVLADAGWDAVVIENFGDAPFEPKAVPPVTVAALTRCALAVREAAPKLALGINVLRNDAMAALAVAVAVDASFIRVNVHIGARVTDQGIVEGRAHETVRARQALRAEGIALFCDVDVKHSARSAPARSKKKPTTSSSAPPPTRSSSPGAGRGEARPARTSSAPPGRRRLRSSSPAASPKRASPRSTPPTA